MAAANVAEVRLAGPVLAAVPTPLPGGTAVIADRAYDSDRLRDRLAGRGLRLLCPHRRGRRRPDRNDGRRMRRYAHRRVVERTFAWLHSYRRLIAGHERYDTTYLAFVQLACLFITLSRF